MFQIRKGTNQACICPATRHFPASLAINCVLKTTFFLTGHKQKLCCHFRARPQNLSTHVSPCCVLPLADQDVATRATSEAPRRRQKSHQQSDSPHDWWSRIATGLTPALDHPLNNKLLILFFEVHIFILRRGGAERG